jgi:Protein of unknown function (DUF2844)
MILQPIFLRLPRVCRRFCEAATLSIAILATVPSAFAALGGPAASVQADQMHMQGTLRTTQAGSYSVQEIQAATGVTVREYVSSSGKVFAVAWHGPWPPQMQQLLGSYFDQYMQAVKAQASAHTARRPLLIQQPGLVVESGGHMRSFSGRAYIPDMLPQGVSAEAIR